MKRDGISKRTARELELHPEIKGKRRLEFLRFARLVEGVLSSVAAIPSDDEHSRDWKVATKAGLMTAHIVPNNTDGPGTIFTRFEEPAWAVMHLGDRAVNPHSGKWNQHYFGVWTADNAAFDFAVTLKKVAIYPLEVSPDAPLPGTKVTEGEILHKLLCRQKRNFTLESLRKKFATWSINSGFQPRCFLIEDDAEGRYKIVSTGEKYRHALQVWQPGCYVVEVDVPPLDELKKRESDLTHA